MSTKRCHRVTLFKIPEEEGQKKLLELYKEMPTKAKRDGKPYLVNVSAGQTFDDERRQGYTVAVVTTFASKDDFHYYDTECEALAEIKAFANTVKTGNMMCYFESAFEGKL